VNESWTIADLVAGKKILEFPTLILVDEFDSNLIEEDASNAVVVEKYVEKIDNDDFVDVGDEIEEHGDVDDDLLVEQLVALPQDVQDELIYRALFEGSEESENEK
jgi:hypothetical protein